MGAQHHIEQKYLDASALREVWAIAARLRGPGEAPPQLRGVAQVLAAKRRLAWARVSVSAGLPPAVSRT
eukprot:COSAG01_NODE_6598_length_3587_cov_3.169725_1_plen_68_part_10